MAKTILDHSFSSHNLLIETKYLRGSTTPSKITDALGADIIKYPTESNLMFIIYDPQRMIADDHDFTSTFESKRNNLTIHIVR